MKHFKKLGHFDPTNALHELNNTNLWNWLNLRRLDPASYHTNVEDIVLRFQPLDRPSNLDFIYNNNYCIDYFVQTLLPITSQVIKDFVANRPCGRVVISKLKANSSIAPHTDDGLYAKCHDRFHLVLESNPQVLFNSGDETINMVSGEIWWFDNMQTHSVYNNSDTDRIHIIVDILTDRYGNNSTT